MRPGGKSFSFFRQLKPAGFAGDSLKLRLRWERKGENLPHLLRICCSPSARKQGVSSSAFSTVLQSGQQRACSISIAGEAASFPTQSSRIGFDRNFALLCSADARRASEMTDFLPLAQMQQPVGPAQVANGGGDLIGKVDDEETVVHGRGLPELRVADADGESAGKDGAALTGSASSSSEDVVEGENLLPEGHDGENERGGEKHQVFPPSLYLLLEGGGGSSTRGKSPSSSSSCALRQGGGGGAESSFPRRFSRYTSTSPSPEDPIANSTLRLPHRANRGLFHHRDSMILAAANELDAVSSRDDWRPLQRNSCSILRVSE